MWQFLHNIPLGYIVFYAILFTMDKMNAQSKTKLGILAEIGACLLFGGSFLFTSVAMEQASAFTMLAWRFFVALILLSILALAGVIKLSLRGKDYKPLFLMALCEPILYFIGESNGILLTTTAESGTIIACIPLATLIFARFLLKERPNRAQWIGISISVFGVILVGLAKGLNASFNIKGYAFLLLAVCGSSLFTIFARKATDFSTAEKTFAMAVLGFIVFGGMALLEHGRAGTLKTLVALPFTSPSFFWSIIYLSLGCQVLAFLFNHYAITAIGPIQANTYIGLVTVVSILLGVVVLHESFALLQGLGSLLVLAGVYIANLTIMRPAGMELEYENKDV